MSSIGTRKIKINFLGPETDRMGQFMGPETDRMCQFMAPETDIMGHISSVSCPNCFFRILANRKRKNNLNMLWIVYEFNRNKKNPFEHKLANFKVFWARKLIYWVSLWAQKLTECVSFWAQKMTLGARDAISLIL